VWHCSAAVRQCLLCRESVLRLYNYTTAYQFYIYTAARHFYNYTKTHQFYIYTAAYHHNNQSSQNLSMSPEAVPEASSTLPLFLYNFALYVP
jgi:hypothetical protein